MLFHLAEEMLCGHQVVGVSVCGGVQWLVFPLIYFLPPFLSHSALRPVALQVYFLPFTGGITLAEDKRGDKGPVTGTLPCQQRTETHQELQHLNAGKTNRRSSARPTSPISCLGFGLWAVVLQAGQRQTAWQLPDENTCDFYESQTRYLRCPTDAADPEALLYCRSCKGQPQASQHVKNMRDQVHRGTS